jgi:hypothetical protein
MRERLVELRDTYEPYASALSHKLALPLPPWTPDGEVAKNWRESAWGTRARESLG